MKKIILIYFLVVQIYTVLNAQFLKKVTENIKDVTVELIDDSKNSFSDAIEYNKIKTIFEEINDEKFEKVKEKIENFEKKYQNNKITNYFYYLIYENEKSNFKNYERAYKYIKNIESNDFSFYDIIDSKEKEKLNKNYNFNKTTLKINFKNIQKKIYTNFSKSEKNLTYFIEKYPESIYIDSAIEYRSQIRYSYTKSINSIDLYKEFILNNPKSMYLKEAYYNLRLLAFEKSVSENTEESYKNFLKYYTGENIFDINVKLKIKFLKINEINNAFYQFNNKYSALIKEFTREIYSDQNNILNNNNKVDYENLISKYSSSKIVYDRNLQINCIINNNYDNISLNTKDVFDPLINLIENFESEYPKAPELYSIRNIKKETIEIKEMILYNLITKYFPNHDTYSKFIETYPNSFYSTIIVNKLKNLNALKKLEADYAEYKINLNKIKELEAKLESSRSDNLIFQVCKRLNTNEIKFLTEIFENKIDNDPARKIGKKCSLGYSKCKWCGKTVSYEKTFSSRVDQLKFIMKINNAQSISQTNDFLNVMTQYAKLMSGNITSKDKIFNARNKEQLITESTLSIKNDIQNIRAGNIYSCDGSGENLFCSLKCENEFKYRN